MRSPNPIFLLVLTFPFVFSQINSLYNLQTGEGTWYTQSDVGTGQCTVINPLPPIASGIYTTVAANDPQFLGSQICGTCLEVTADGTGSGTDPIPKGPIIVLVTDRCPECPSGNLDFRNNPQKSGRWNIKWRIVECPGTGNLAYTFQGSHQYYVKIQVRNGKFPIKSLTVLNNDGQYETMERTSDNFFTAPSGSKIFPVKWPLSIKVTSINDDTVSDRIPWSGDQTKAPPSDMITNGMDNVQFSSNSAPATAQATLTNSPDSSTPQVSVGSTNSIVSRVSTNSNTSPSSPIVKSTQINPNSSNRLGSVCFIFYLFLYLIL